MASLGSSRRPREGVVPYAREVLRAEADALVAVADRLDESFEQAVRMLLSCPERIAVTGVGKSLHIGQKIVGTLNSTGIRAYLLDATAALHGDLGMVHPRDIAIALSHSGESEELQRLLPWLRTQSAGLIAITGNPRGTLARQANVVICYGPISESCPLSLAPSTSTTVMMALGDALAFTLMEMRSFTAEEFARFHPAGSLGRKLAHVEQLMRRGDELRIAPASASVREVFANEVHHGRRSGALMLVDERGRLCGLFTDSDLARLFELRKDEALDRPIAEVMTRQPLTIAPTARLVEALEMLRHHKISELPVVDHQGCPVGLLDITDVIGLVPAEVEESEPPRAHRIPA